MLRGEARHASTSGALERYSHRPGAFLVDADPHADPHAGAEAASSQDDRHGAAMAARALEAERAGHCLISFETNAIDLRPGSIVTIESHAHPEVDLRGSGLLVTSVSIDGTPNGEWTIQATAVPASEPYRPPQRTPRPRACSVESATVVGPIGQEIHTDEHGRVRVQFPWDRQGRSDERSSCWLRVAQGWAGPGLGLFAVPRVGQEVLVGFLGGDPDQPIIVGRLSNPLNPPPIRLPEEQAHSVWRSASSPGGDGFNEIRLEDGRGAELLSLRAEQDMGIDVLRHRAEMIGGDETVRLEGRLVRHTGGDAHVTVAGDQRERIGGTRSLTVDGDQHQRVGGAAALGARAIHLQAGGALVLEGGDITLRGPGGFIRIDGSGVSIDGALVHLQSGGAPGEAPGAAPAQPLVPQRVDTRTPGPRRLPLLGFPGLPPLQMPAPGGGGGGPLTPDEAALCGIICGCRDDPSPNTRPSDCVTARIRALEDASGQTTRIMAEVPYDMSTTPPRPIMSRNDPRRPTRRRPADSRIPDVIIRKDPTRPPTQDNIEEVIEIKFPPDTFRRDQLRSYERIAGDARFEEFGPARCRCPDPKPRPVRAEEVTTAAAITVLLIAMLLARQPGAAARLLDKLAPLMSRLIPLLTP